MSKSIELKLKKIIKEEVGIENIDINEELIDYGLNSSGVLSIIIGIENEFCFEFKDDGFDSANFKTLSSLITYIEKNI